MRYIYIVFSLSRYHDFISKNIFMFYRALYLYRDLASIIINST